MRGSVGASWVVQLGKVLQAQASRLAWRAVTREVARTGQLGRDHRATSGNYATSGRYVVLPSASCQCTRAARPPAAPPPGSPPASSWCRGRIFLALSPGLKGRPEGRFHLLQQARQGIRLHPGQLGFDDGGVGCRVARAREEGLGQQRPDALAGCTEVRGPTQRPDGFPWARVTEDRLAEAKVDVRCGTAITRVLNAEPEHLFTFAHLAQRDASAAQQAERLGDQGTRFWAEHLAVGRAQEDRERRRPSAEQFQNPYLIAARRG